jgi:hypothetical protein
MCGHDLRVQSTRVSFLFNFDAGSSPHTYGPGHRSTGTINFINLLM